MVIVWEGAQVWGRGGGMAIDAARTGVSFLLHYSPRFQPAAGFSYCKVVGRRSGNSSWVETALVHYSLYSQ